MIEWLTIARNQAEERFRSLPFPGAKDENFRFTTLEYKESNVSDTRLSLPVAPRELCAIGAEEQAVLVLNGEDASSVGETPGFLLTDVMRAAILGSDYMRTRIRDGEMFRDDKFAQLTSARWKNGVFFHVPAGVKLAKPVRFVAAAPGAEEHFRNLILLEEGAEAVVIQECWSDEAARFVGELTEVKLGRNSKLHWVVLQAWGQETSGAIRQRIDLAEGAELRFTPLYVGGKTVQARQEAHLGAGSSFDTQGAARGDSQQHVDFWLDVRHEGSRSRSHMDYWFVMAGKARGVFNGQIEVQKGALECESAQRSKTLLLGSGSVHSIPRLIIRTDEVKASHGASVSSVSPEQLHYLQSRGIPRAEAEEMIVRGFTEVVVERFPTEALQARAEKLLGSKQAAGTASQQPGGSP